MKDFCNKVVVITGAGSGMGRAYAMAFAQQGSMLAICDLDMAALNETVTLLKGVTNRNVLSRVFSVSSQSAMEDFAEDVKNELGNAHIVINNAGIEGSGKSVVDTDNECFARLMEVNYLGVVIGTRAFLPQLEANVEAALVNVSSIFGMIGAPENADYCASKFAVRGFTEALMVELDQSHIQVHLVHPGGIATNLIKSDGQIELAKKFLTTPPEKVADYLIHSIRKNRKRVVYGNRSFITRISTHLLPLSWRIKFIALQTN